MKKLLLTVVLGLCTLAGFSQAKFDVHAGMSMANITNSDADLKIGYSVGVGMDYEEFYKLKYCSTVVYMVPRA